MSNLVEKARQALQNTPFWKNAEFTETEPTVVAAVAHRIAKADGTPHPEVSTLGGLLGNAADADAARVLLELPLKATASVDLEATAETVIYTPPAGYELYVVAAFLRYDTEDTVSGGATVKLTNGTGDISADLSTGTSPVADTYTAFALETSGVVLCTSAAPLTLDVTGATATELTGTAIVLGYLHPTS